ncbi:MAG: tetratricopeptide repeat protein [Treponemataceae bacterium]|nr:tetratricopeptide repeat protein [Treponemataceae bacterium]
MEASKALDSVVFINLPEDFSLSQHAMHIDTTIPLPVQLPYSNGSFDKDSFDMSQLTQEMILAGILTILAYDRNNQHIQYYRSILNTARPDIKRELTEAAILKARNEDFEISEEIFMALRGLDPEDMAIMLNTALFFDQRADSLRKSNLIEDADAYDEEAHNYYKIVMDADPAVPDAFFNAAFFYLKQRNYTRAKDCLETYIALMVDVPEEELGENGEYKMQRAQEIIDDISSRNLDDELFKKAYDLIQMEKEEEALEPIREFLQKNGDVWNGWFLCGWALRRLGRWSDAKAAFQQVLKLNGDHVDTYNELALCNRELGEYDEAKAHLMKAITLEPENTKIMSNLGFLAQEQGDYETARKYFTIVLEFDPDDKIALAGLESLEV